MKIKACAIHRTGLDSVVCRLPTGNRPPRSVSALGVVLRCALIQVRLEDEHTVAEAEEAIALRHRLSVSGKDSLSPG